MRSRDIIVIGGSAGALQPLLNVMTELPLGLEAKLFVVLHRAAQGDDNLGPLMARSSRLSVGTAEDGQPLVNGTVYIAPSDRHLILKEDHIRISRGPRENQFRPSIDVLFRSAAVAFGPRVTGIVLSGALDDGSAGLSAIKRCGGIAIVQDPADAAVRDMPESAIRNTRTDYVIPAQQIASLIQRLAVQPIGPAPGIPAELILEAKIAETGLTSVDIQNRLGDLTPFTCADCGGPLWRQHADGLRFRCLTGHALSVRSLEEGLNENLNVALWAALRQFEQRANLQLAMAQEEERKGRSFLASSQRDRAKEARAHAVALRGLLIGIEGSSRQDSAFLPPPSTATSGNEAE
jgi:two-component system chemotaxis response regulator CheB